MKFVARHISFEVVDGAFSLALSEQPGPTGPSQSDAFVIIQFGEEDGQDCALGLTGLHLSGSSGVPEGYGKIDDIAYDGSTISISGHDGFDKIEAEIATQMMTPNAIEAAVEMCNRANATRPEA